MIFRSGFISFIVILFSLQSLFALETDTEARAETGEGEAAASFPLGITAIELEAYLGAEYNRGNFNNGSVMLIAGIEFIDLVFLRCGLSYTQSTLSTNLDSFFNAKVSPFSGRYLSPLNFSVSYIYNGMLDLDVHMHSVLPFISYETSRAGVSIGCSFRFTSFFGEEPEFETVLSFYGYFNFITTETFMLGLGAGTFNNFNARNMAAIWLNINAKFLLNRNFSIYNEIEIMQSGMDGLSATFYGFAWRGGVKYSW